MKRTIEKLTKQRQEKEKEFTAKLEELKNKTEKLQSLQASLKSLPLPTTEDFQQKGRLKKGETLKLINNNILPYLSDLGNALEQNLEQTQELISLTAALLETHTALMDAKDKEWDALAATMWA